MSSSRPELPALRPGDGWSPHALRAERQEYGFTQEQVAEELGCRQETVSKWELGATVPDPPTLRTLAAFFGRADWMPLPYGEGEDLTPLSFDAAQNLVRRWRARRQDLLQPMRRSLLSPRARQWRAHTTAAYEECARELEALANRGRKTRRR